MNGKTVLQETIKSAPKSAGVYRMLNSENKVLYVGKAKNLYNRLSSYTNLKQLTKRIQQMVILTHKVEIIITNSETEALLLEANLIKTLNPIYNIRLRDDKSFPYLFINNNHSFPGLFKVRKKQAEGKYFGPFASGYDVNNILELLRKSFLIRSCSDNEFKQRKRPCLEYHIKRCAAPCVSLISEDKYQSLIKDSINFIEGRNSKLRDDLIEEMQQESAQMNYEKAAFLRDRIKAINTILAKQNITNINLDEFDIVALAEESGKFAIQIFFYRAGISYGNENFFLKATSEDTKEEALSQFLKQFYTENFIPKNIIINLELEEQNAIAEAFSQIANKKIELSYPKTGKKKEMVNFAMANAKLAIERKLSEKKSIEQIYFKLKETFFLTRIPRKIELYDNSHIQGEYAIGAMVAANQTGFLKQNYRKFNISDQTIKGDDYAMLKEVLVRRFSRLLHDDPDNKNESWPDLIFIDGGKGHATIAQEAFDALGISDFPFFCIAKGKERNKGKERFCNSKHDYFSIKDRELLYYLQRVRDEVHRYAITSHRNKRSKSLTKSALDNIAGIGATKKKNLLNHFGSIANITAAACNDLEKVQGINKKLAQQIFNHLHPK